MKKFFYSNAFIKVMALQAFAMNLNTTETETLTTENAHSYWQTALIYLAGPQCVHDQLAQLTTVPEGNSTHVDFHVSESLDTDPLNHVLTEGVPGAGQQLSIRQVRVELEQYGDFVPISDMMQLVSKHGMFRVATQALSAQASGISDKITRNALQETDNIIYAGGVDELSDITKATYLTVDDFFVAAARLKGANTPVFSDGCYRSVIHPYVSKDVMSNLAGTTAWLDIKKYANPEDILNGEIGKVAQVRILESTNAKFYAPGDPLMDGAAAGVAIFSTVVCGDGAVGTTELSGNGLKMIIKSNKEVGGPLEQYGTAGFKMLKAAEILVDAYACKILSSCSLAALVTESN